MKTDVISLSQNQLIRLDIINKANAGFITVAEAASALGLSQRQVKRLKKEVKEQGPVALIHKNSLKKPKNAIADDVAKSIIALKNSSLYEKANFTHFRELLEQHHGIKISYSALYGILNSHNIKSPLTRRRYKLHRRRARKKQMGLLLQFDATPHAWFGGNKKFALHGSIDDASGQVTALYMTKNECLLGYFETLGATIKSFGLPASLYVDMHSIFRSPAANKMSLEEQLAGKTVRDTQFSRALKELGINIIYARSPQAKGRVERLWATLQSRLPVEFAIRNITTIDAANEFLKSYVHSFNALFAVEPQDVESAFRAVPDGLNIEYSLCLKDQRTLDAGAVFSFFNKNYVIVNSQLSKLLPPKANILVLTSHVFGIKAQYKGFIFDVVRFVKPQKAKLSKKQEANSHYVPGPDHPWRMHSSLPVGYAYSVDYDYEYVQVVNKIISRLTSTRYV